MTEIEAAHLAARVFSCGLWLAMGIYKILNFKESAEDMAQHGIPKARLLLPVVLVLMLGGSALVIADWYTWAVSLAWIAFSVVAGWIYHRGFVTPQRTIDFFQLVLFWKNASMIGGLIALILLDPSRPAWLFRG